MSNPHFLTDDWGVPPELASELMEWARVQDVHIHVACKFPENERAYQRARLLIRRVRDLGYRNRKDVAA